MSPHMPIFFADILSAGAVAVRVRKKRLGAGADNNNSKMVCALTAYVQLVYSASRQFTLLHHSVG